MSPSMVQTVGGGLLVSPSLAQPRGCTLRVRPPRVATRRRPATCSELASCGRPRPRVVIVVPTVSDLAMRLRGDLPKWRASSLDWCANPPGDRRECGRRYKPGVRHPPRVAIVVPTPWCNDSCRNSRRAPDSTRCSYGVCCGVQPRGVTTRVVIRGRTAPNSFNTMKGRRFIYGGG